MPRQYVAAKFHEMSARTYTYHNDGEPLAPGDQAKVHDPSGGGWKRVFVASVSDVAPNFATKEILGKITEETEN